MDVLWGRHHNPLCRAQECGQIDKASRIWGADPILFGLRHLLIVPHASLVLSPSPSKERRSDRCSLNCTYVQTHRVLAYHLSVVDSPLVQVHLPQLQLLLAFFPSSVRVLFVPNQNHSRASFLPSSTFVRSRISQGGSPRCRVLRHSHVTLRAASTPYVLLSWGVDRWSALDRI
jgi:hypothetical protein